MVQTATTPAGTEAAGSSPLDCLTEFTSVQAQRAQLYSRFHQGFKRFLETKQEGIFRTLMAETTIAFSECSRQVIALEEAMKDRCGRADLAMLLRRIQSMEREKLQLTLSLQALKQAGAAGGFSWQRAAAEEARRGEGGTFGAQGDVDPLEPQGEEGHVHGATCGHAHACCGHEAPPEEPSQEEYEGALAEATQLLDKCVNGINEVLEEVQEHIAELHDDEA